MPKMTPFLERVAYQGIASPRDMAMQRQAQARAIEEEKLALQAQRLQTEAEQRNAQAGGYTPYQLWQMEQEKQRQAAAQRNKFSNPVEQNGIFYQHEMGPDNRVLNTRRLGTNTTPTNSVGPLAGGYRYGEGGSGTGGATPGIVDGQRFNAPQQQQPKLTALQEKIEIMAGKPFGELSLEEKQAAMAKIGGGQTINVGGEKNDPLSKFTEGYIERANEAALVAQETVANSQIGLEILQKRLQGGGTTGAWEPMKMEMARYLGLSPDQVSNIELFDTKMGDAVMSRISQTKGAVSEKEMAYFKKISPGSDKTPFTNYVLLEINRRQGMRQQDKMQYIPEYLEKNKNLNGFDAWYMKEKDPFGDFNLDAMKSDFDKWSTPDGQDEFAGFEIIGRGN